jgi:hypothetical protein
MMAPRWQSKSLTKEDFSMVDNVNPTSQFHPYQPPDAVPQSERQPSGGLRGILGNSLKNVDLNGNLNKARTFARSNGGMALGGLAALVIGAGLLRGRK